MSTVLKRKGSPSLEVAEESSKRRFAEATSDEPPTSTDVHDIPTTEPTQVTSGHASPGSPPPSSSSSSPPPSSAPAPPNDRLAARFAALKARSAASRKSNLSATKTEAAQRSTPTGALASLARRRETAEHKLLKAETAARGEDFERKRAWDWTAEESARWDERVAEKRERAEKNKFSDFAQEAAKNYERQIGALSRRGGGGADGAEEGRAREYEEEKARAIERAVASGGLELVELESGEVVAVDRDGGFVSSAASSAMAEGGAGGRPSKEAVDRLVADIRKAEEVRLRKRRERGLRDEDGGDVTYINAKNKQFNLKLARAYDKYTVDIRESFERGTAI